MIRITVLLMLFYSNAYADDNGAVAAAQTSASAMNSAYGGNGAGGDGN